MSYDFNTVLIIIISIGMLFLASYAYGSFSRKEEDTRIFNGLHDCGIRALLVIFPRVSREKIHNTFMNCCDEWPYNGIADTEFNVGLRQLGLYERFEYKITNVPIKTLLIDTQHSYIALIPGHYTVVRAGKIVDSDSPNGISPSTPILAYWKLM